MNCKRCKLPARLTTIPAQAILGGTALLRRYYCKGCRQAFDSVETWIRERDRRELMAEDVLWGLGESDMPL